MRVDTLHKGENDDDDNNNNVLFSKCLLTSWLHSTIANQAEQEHEYYKNAIKTHKKWNSKQRKQEKQILKQQYK
jgi:hypothetical protein